MVDTDGVVPPRQYDRILKRSLEAGFAMNSDLLTGSLLRTLAASKPGGSFLEMGTGAGLSTSWLLDGMDAASTLTSVDNDPTIQAIAKEELGSDSRLKLVLSDGAEFLERCESQFDFIFADTWAGKYTHMKLCMELLRPSGIWVIDDMLPQPNWPDGHAERAAKLLSELNHLTGFQVTRFSWSTGLVVAVKLPTS